MPTTLLSPTPIEPIHPGVVLREDFLVPLGLSANALAGKIGVPVNGISMIVAGKRGIGGDTALRLAAAFGTPPEFRMNLQKNWELDVAREEFVGEVERVA